MEITGVPITPHDNPKQIVKEIGSLIGVDVKDSDIAAAHKLPAFKKVKITRLNFYREIEKGSLQEVKEFGCMGRHKWFAL